MYEELVAWLRSWSELPAHCECYESCDECDKQDICSTFTNERIITKAGEAADAIEELSKPRWISVEERLPKEEAEIYWCYTNMGIMCECRWTNNRFGVGESDKWGWNIMDVPQYQKVTHWMPLPEPPKEE